MKPTDLAIHLSSFLGEYLPARRNLSPNTIKSYRDVFALLLRYCRDKKNIPPERLRIEQLDARLLSDFLEHLEKERHCSPRTRNQRLAALHAFFHYLQSEEPQFLFHCQRVLSIPFKRHESSDVNYLSPEDVAAILSQPDLSTPQGRRDAVLLSVLYDTGIRVQELIDISVHDVRLETPAQIRVTGKGRKTRVIPLMKQTAHLLADYMREHNLDIGTRGCEPFFRNRYGTHLSRSGVRHILDKYVQATRSVCINLNEKIGPHTFRHTKAMHLLQAGNPLIVIKHILGHADVETTQMYVKADMEMKRAALEKAVVPSHIPKLPEWQTNKDLLDWLKSL